MIQPIEQLGLMPQRTGAFFLNMEKKECEFIMQNQSWKFEIKKLSLKKIVLSPKPLSDFQFELELITYPSPL